ncbi:DUF1223 domain-containing protein [Pseudodonghicola xiamenensis]|uniref:Coproporphyrinogen III oxidase n=1 Tax=Pseudodonghicola xiamenensis TaxID=337702 RepID=A0A8J3H9P2_9RHOB|nr:DUF1223 domain-containing protein [Pseudodonghicola xiamenensis]GHG93070.1 coproporphyrinogen III oxidase [Pseudodonghicola xiamenensis]
MKRIVASLAVAWMAFAGPLSAQESGGPVVVELFTSQGCSSCPPADLLLQKLTGREDVLPLALHVDYWDYIGWKDTFADPFFTLRQKGYARAAGRRMIYTPQIVVMGQDDVVGADAMELADLIMAQLRRPKQVEISARRGKAGSVAVRLRPVATVAGAYDVQLVRYTPIEHVRIARGENAGKNIDYVNVVDGWQLLGRWDGTSEANFQSPLEEDDDRPGAVLVQQAGFGPIIGAARVTR